MVSNIPRRTFGAKVVTTNPLESDWRRQGQENYLKGKVLTLQRYRPFRDGWDHDHCEFCGTKFSVAAGDLNQGYSADNGYQWICPNCFRDFKDEFEWVISEGMPKKA
jgi:hypothetical protein